MMIKMTSVRARTVTKNGLPVSPLTLVAMPTSTAKHARPVGRKTVVEMTVSESIIFLITITLGNTEINS